MRCLFIGGLADGRVIDVENPDSPHWQVSDQLIRELEPLEEMDFSKPADIENEKVNTQTYGRRKLGCEGSPYTIYVHPPDLPDREWLRMLVNGYKRP